MVGKIKIGLKRQWTEAGIPLETVASGKTVAIIPRMEKTADDIMFARDVVKAYNLALVVKRRRQSVERAARQAANIRLRPVDTLGAGTLGGDW